MQHVQVNKWGNSLGFRIPRGIVDSLDIKSGDALELIPSAQGVLIKKVEPKGKKYDLASILSSFAAAEQHEEVDLGEPVGKEIW